jgi:alkaline phosphatase
MKRYRAWAVGLVAFAVASALAAPAQLAGARAPDFSGVKNVILFIGDGMGPKEVKLGELMSGGPLWTEAVPWTTGSLATASLDGVTDSAAAATALATGVETHNTELSVAPDGTPVETVLERAESNGMATGLVTTDAEAEATPAAFAAHVTNRDRTLAITSQILGQGIEVLLSSSWSYASLLDGRSGVTYVENSTDLAPYLAGQTPWPTSLYGFIGLGKKPMAHSLDREELGAVGVQPTLTDFTTAALGVLGQDPNGFFLMVEGAQIDWCGHQVDAACDAADVEEFARAVQVGVDYASGRDDTLVLVTADHETGGLKLGSGIDTSVIAGQSATNLFMWRQIKSGHLTAEQAMATYAGITDLTPAEKRLLTKYDNWKTVIGISDVLSPREHLIWDSSGGYYGHTATDTPMYAFGPGQDAFAGRYANERVGRLLLKAVSD